MKGQNRPLPPPFEINSAAMWQWTELQEECGGTFRGKGFTAAQIWKLAVVAEHQADWRRNHIEPKYFDTMKIYRQQLGLPPLPPIVSKAA